MKETLGFLAKGIIGPIWCHKRFTIVISIQHGLRLRIANQWLKKIKSIFFDLKINIFQLRFICVKSIAVLIINNV